MSTEVRKFLLNLIKTVEGLHNMYITDRDGVPLLSIANRHIGELSKKISLLSTFAMASDQGSKLGLGKNKTIICIYSNYQIVQMNKLPLIICFIASHDCNTGHILSLEEKIDPILSTLKDAVGEA